MTELTKEDKLKIIKDYANNHYANYGFKRIWLMIVELLNRLYGIRLYYNPDGYLKDYDSKFRFGMDNKLLGSLNASGKAEELYVLLEEIYEKRMNYERSCILKGSAPLVEIDELCGKFIELFGEAPRVRYDGCPEEWVFSNYIIETEYGSYTADKFNAMVENNWEIKIFYDEHREKFKEYGIKLEIGENNPYAHYYFELKSELLGKSNIIEDWLDMKVIFNEWAREIKKI